MAVETTGTIVMAWRDWCPDLVTTILGAVVPIMSFAIGGTASFVLIPVPAERRCMTVQRANAVSEFVRSAANPPPQPSGIAPISKSCASVGSRTA